MNANIDGRPPKKDLKIVIRKLHEEGFSYAEIGKQLGMTRQNVNYHMNRVLKTLSTGHPIDKETVKD